MLLLIQSSHFQWETKFPAPFTRQEIRAYQDNNGFFFCVEWTSQDFSPFLLFYILIISMGEKKNNNQDPEPALGCSRRWNGTDVGEATRLWLTCGSANQISSLRAPSLDSTSRVGPAFPAITHANPGVTMKCDKKKDKKTKPTPHHNTPEHNTRLVLFCLVTA